MWIERLESGGPHPVYFLPIIAFCFVNFSFTFLKYFGWTLDFSGRVNLRVREMKLIRYLFLLQPWLRRSDWYVGGAGRAVDAGQGDGGDGAGGEPAAGPVPVLGLPAPCPAGRPLERGVAAVLEEGGQDTHVGKLSSENNFLLWKTKLGPRHSRRDLSTIWITLNADT